MASNSRLAIAVHSAGLLAIAGETPMTSESLALSSRTNPVVVRRIVGALAKAGIVGVKKGAGGGAYLLREPEDISLADIHDALGECELFAVPDLGPSHECPVGKIVRPVLEQYFGSAENAMKEYLAKVSLQDVIDSVRIRMSGGECRGELNGRG